MADNAGSDPSDDESDIYSDASESDDDFDPSEVFLTRGKGRIPRNVRRVEIHRSVKFIPHHLFARCRQLESVLLHEALLKIGEFAFSGCSSLRSIKFPSTVIEIGDYAFYECSNLATVDLPKGLESIENAAFRGCTSLEEVHIPASVARIGRGTFGGCTNLALVELREGLQKIGYRAFHGCSSLGRLRVPLSVGEIEQWAFDGCSSLSLIQLSEDLPRMGKFAFRGCTSLECYEFVRLSERIEPICMDDAAESMFERRLREMTRALTGADEEDESDGEVDLEAICTIWVKCKESLVRAHEFLTYLELKGAVPVLELALWKAKIEGQREGGIREGCVNIVEGGQDLSEAGRDRKRPKVTKDIGQDTRLSREDCRVKCGAGIVIPEVLKFFTYRSSWPRLYDMEEGNVN